MSRLFLLDPDDPESPFPDAGQALTDPDGLLAVGGDLSAKRLINAYRHGIFPWYQDNQPILWWSPNPRTVMVPGQMRITRSLGKRLRNAGFSISLDRAFVQVVKHCSLPRNKEHPGSWITQDMQAAYQQLHDLGYAHSIEVYLDDKLVGGLYGVALGRIFFGESMFSLERDASKVALAWLDAQLTAWKFKLIDCQIESGHMRSLGATLMPREQFLALLDRYCNVPAKPGTWQLEIDDGWVKT